MRRGGCARSTRGATTIGPPIHASCRAAPTKPMSIGSRVRSEATHGKATTAMPSPTFETADALISARSKRGDGAAYWSSAHSSNQAESNVTQDRSDCRASARCGKSPGHGVLALAEREAVLGVLDASRWFTGRTTRDLLPMCLVVIWAGSWPHGSTTRPARGAPRLPSGAPGRHLARWLRHPQPGATSAPVPLCAAPRSGNQGARDPPHRRIAATHVHRVAVAGRARIGRADRTCGSAPGVHDRRGSSRARGDR